MALCSLKSSTQLALGQQQRDLGYRSAVQRGSSVRTRVAQPSTSSAAPSSAIFEHRGALVKGNHFTLHQAESLLTVFPTMMDVASKDDVMRLERVVTTGFQEQKSRFDQVQLLAVLLALAVVVIVGLLAGALMVFSLNPSSALGMVVSAFIKKMR